MFILEEGADANTQRQGFQMSYLPEPPPPLLKNRAPANFYIFSLLLKMFFTYLYLVTVLWDHK